MYYRCGTIGHIEVLCNYAPVQVNPWGQAYDRGLSDHTGDSDNNNSFWHHSDITKGINIECLGGDSDNES